MKPSTLCFLYGWCVLLGGAVSWALGDAAAAIVAAMVAFLSLLAHEICRAIEGNKP